MTLIKLIFADNLMFKKLPRRPAYANLSFGGYNKASSPLIYVFGLENFAYAFCQAEAARRMETYQENAEVRAGNEPSKIREIQILGDKESLFPLRCFPNYRIQTARKSLVVNSVNVMPEAA